MSESSLCSTSPMQVMSVDLRQERLGGLQSLRALAAFGVVLQHAIYYACAARGVDYMQYLKIGFGGLGVNLFFVISGFIMAGCTYQGNRFLWNRALRIYPGFWLAIALSGLLLAYSESGWVFTLTSMFLMPSTLNSSYHIPYWTLIYEMGFYVLVALLVTLKLSAQALARFCLFWLLVIAVVSRYTTISIVEPGIFLWLAPHNVFFIIGLLTGLYYQGFGNIPSVVFGVVAVICCTLGETLHSESQISAFMFSAIGFSALILLAIRHLRIRLLEYIGDASYGIYLLHAPILVLSIYLLQMWAQEIHLFTLFVISMMAALIGSTIFGRFEYALHAWLKALRAWR